jgi:phenylpropionate dioxygenase-like ring-hydroxylating dioxygenase large terminal subunit
MTIKSISIFDDSNVNATRSDLDKALSLPPKCYTSEEFYALEVEHIFRKNWLTVGRIQQIPNPGDYFTIDICNDLLVVVKGEDELVRVMSRVCRHRWMEVVQGSGNSKAFRCPYHGWTYDLKGNLRAAPSMDKQNFDKKQCNLPQLKVEIWQGFIFVNYDINAQPLGDSLKGLEKKLENYQLSNMQTIEPITYESDWNWKVMVENASEVYHLGLHQDTLLSNLPLRSSIIEDCDGPYTYYRIPNKDRMPLQTSFKPLDSLNEEQLSEFVLCTIFPCHIMIINPDQVTWVQILPKSATTHTITFHLCFQPSAFSDRYFRQKCKLGKWFLERIHEEDIFACQSVQKGLNSKFAMPTSFSYLEKSIWQFHNWILDQLNLNKVEE